MRLLLAVVVCLAPLIAYSGEPEPAKPATDKPAEDKTTDTIKRTIGGDVQPAPPVDKFVVPDVSITGAESAIQYGDIVDLRIAPLVNKPQYLQDVVYTWTIVPAHAHVLVWPDGTRLVFGSGTATAKYTVIVTASYLYTVKEGDKITEVAQRVSTATKDVAISAGSQAPPPPSPTNPMPTTPDTPDPGPTPGPAPDDATGLYGDVQQWVTELKLDPAIKKQGCAKLAESFGSVATGITAGVINDIASIMRKTKQQNDAAINNNPVWQPWFVKLAAKLSGLYKAGIIVTPEDFAAAWTEIANGLLAASKQ